MHIIPISYRVQSKGRPASFETDTLEDFILCYLRQHDRPHGILFQLLSDSELSCTLTTVREVHYRIYASFQSGEDDSHLPHRLFMS